MIKRNGLYKKNSSNNSTNNLIKYSKILHQKEHKEKPNARNILVNKCDDKGILTRHFWAILWH